MSVAAASNPVSIERNRFFWFDFEMCSKFNSIFKQNEILRIWIHTALYSFNERDAASNIRQQKKCGKTETDVFSNSNSKPTAIAINA